MPSLRQDPRLLAEACGAVLQVQGLRSQIQREALKLQISLDLRSQIQESRSLMHSHVDLRLALLRIKSLVLFMILQGQVVVTGPARLIT